MRQEDQLIKMRQLNRVWKGHMEASNPFDRSLCINDYIISYGHRSQRKKKLMNIPSIAPARLTSLRSLILIISQYDLHDRALAIKTFGLATLSSLSSLTSLEFSGSYDCWNVYCQLIGLHHDELSSKALQLLTDIDKPIVPTPGISMLHHQPSSNSSVPLHIPNLRSLRVWQLASEKEESSKWVYDSHLAQWPSLSSLTSLRIGMVDIAFLPRSLRSLRLELSPFMHDHNECGRFIPSARNYTANIHNYCRFNHLCHLTSLIYDTGDPPIDWMSNAMCMSAAESLTFAYVPLFPLAFAQRRRPQQHQSYS
jgi:hypothetical protein